MVFETRLLIALESFFIFILNKVTFLQHDFMSFVLTFFLGFVFGNQYGTILTHFRNEVVWEGFLIFLTLVFLELLGWFAYKQNVKSFQTFFPNLLFSKQNSDQTPSFNKKVIKKVKKTKLALVTELDKTKGVEPQEKISKAKWKWLQKERLSRHVPQKSFPLPLYWLYKKIHSFWSNGRSSFLKSRWNNKKIKCTDPSLKTPFSRSKKNKEQPLNKFLSSLKRLKLFRIGFLFGIFVEGFKVGS